VPAQGDAPPGESAVRHGHAAGQVVGTAPYMSGQARGLAVNARRRLCSAALKMLAGRRAFGGATTDVLAAIVRED
jgi:hypothetical protein